MVPPISLRLSKAQVLRRARLTVAQGNWKPVFDGTQNLQDSKL